MRNILFKKTALDGLQIVEPTLIEDKRGYFSKQFEKDIFEVHGIIFCPFEEMISRSSQGVIRGLHFQRRHSQDKLVRVLKGAVYDVAVDLRQGSSTFGKWEGFELTSENRQMLYIPKGFAHGFLALEEDTLFHYLCGDRYDPESDGGIFWDDPDLAVEWPLEWIEQVIVSEKDKKLPTLAQFKSTYGALSVGEIS